MTSSKTQIDAEFHRINKICFEKRQMTSFVDLFISQFLFNDFMMGALVSV